MKNKEINQLLQQVLENQYVQQGRLYQQSMMTKCVDKAEQLKQALPEHIKLNLPNISIGVFDGEFEEKNQSFIEQIKKTGLGKYIK
ncbi:hypothetical protein GCM10027155_10720 [Acinetobacter apis]|uniref:Uncharacterized protein n=1 Tax=Acinetobacter apis TaxID=1229165 RepID=A0A217EG20_9GAMM|nr:hypothetical protein [Acinetobacter apis]SNQ29150.1 hypothetical protein SAMN05444584_1086 [Acinetobacter apis]